MESYSISKARLADVPALKRIEAECELSPWTIAAYRSELEHPHSIMLTARAADGAIVGFIVGRAVSDGDAEIQNLGTIREVRRRGVGSTLIKAFKGICSERQVSGIWLEVRVTNRSAIDFYRSHGFVKKGIRPNFYTNPIENADLMYAALT